MNSLEERIVSELKAERDLVPRAKAGELPTPPSRWPRYLAVAAVGVVIAAGAWTVGQLGDEAAPAATAEGFVLTLYSTFESQQDTIEIEVTSERAERNAGRDVFIGVIDPTPLTFSPPGVELPIVQERVPEMSGHFQGAIGPIVYLGDVGWDSHFVHASTGNSLPGPLGSWFSAVVGQRLLCHTSLPGGGSSCAAGFSTPDFLIGGSDGPVNGGHTHHLLWAGLPADTAVVTFELADGDIFWQRPTGGAAIMNWQDNRAEAEFVVQALSTDGSVLLERDQR